MKVKKHNMKQDMMCYNCGVVRARTHFANKPFTLIERIETHTKDGVIIRDIIKPICIFCKRRGRPDKRLNRKVKK